MKAQHYFRHHHNWNVLSGPISQEIDKLVPHPKNLQPFNLDFLKNYHTTQSLNKVVYIDKINFEKEEYKQRIKLWRETLNYREETNFKNIMINFLIMLRYDNFVVWVISKIKRTLQNKLKCFLNNF
jgi:hypothetical protein